MTEFVWNQDNLDLFWEFIYERQMVWHRRFVEKKLPPWTEDPILRKNKFTNIYRILDTGTEFSRDQIMELDEPRADKIFNVMIYRLMCNIPTYRRLGFQRLKEFDSDRFEAELEKIYYTGEPVFGNAYLISPYSSMGSDYKYVNVARLFGDIHRTFSGFIRELDKATSMEKAFKVVNRQYGFGPFLAYQVCVDLIYPNRKTGEKILPFDQDDWARLGPGALRGLARLTKTWSTAQTLEALRLLRLREAFEFERLGLEFPWWRDEYGLAHPISLSDMQNCLCEFSKYANILGGSGKAQRLFVPSERRPW